MKRYIFVTRLVLLSVLVSSAGSAQMSTSSAAADPFGLPMSAQSESAFYRLEFIQAIQL